MPFRQIQKMGVIPNLKVALIDFGKIHLSRKRLLKSASIGHSQKNIFSGNGCQALEHPFWAIDMFQNMQAKNDVKSSWREGIGGNLGFCQFCGESLLPRKADARWVQVGALHGPALISKKRHRFPSTTTPVKQSAGGLGMAAEEIAGTDFPVLLEKVVSVGPRIDLVGEMLKLCHVAEGGSYFRGG